MQLHSSASNLGVITPNGKYYYCPFFFVTNLTVSPNPNILMNALKTLHLEKYNPRKKPILLLFAILTRKTQCWQFHPSVNFKYSEDISHTNCHEQKCCMGSMTSVWNHFTCHKVCSMYIHSACITMYITIYTTCFMRGILRYKLLTPHNNFAYMAVVKGDIFTIWNSWGSLYSNRWVRETGIICLLHVLGNINRDAL